MSGTVFFGTNKVSPEWSQRYQVLKKEVPETTDQGQLAGKPKLRP